MCTGLLNAKFGKVSQACAFTHTAPLLGTNQTLTEMLTVLNAIEKEKDVTAFRAFFSPLSLNIIYFCGSPKGRFMFYVHK